MSLLLPIQEMCASQLLPASTVLTERSLQLVIVVRQKLHAREIVHTILTDLSVVLQEVVIN